MFAIGAGNLGWMRALRMVMGVEKSVVRPALIAPLSVLLILWGLAVALGAAHPFR